MCGIVDDIGGAKIVTATKWITGLIVIIASHEAKNAVKYM